MYTIMPSVLSCVAYDRAFDALILQYSHYKKCIAKPKKLRMQESNSHYKKCNYKPKKFHVLDSNWGC